MIANGSFSSQSTTMMKIDGMIHAPHRISVAHDALLCSFRGDRRRYTAMMQHFERNIVMR